MKEDGKEKGERAQKLTTLSPVVAACITESPHDSPLYAMLSGPDGRKRGLATSTSACPAGRDNATARMHEFNNVIMRSILESAWPIPRRVNSGCLAGIGFYPDI